jgi:hypothetical protein
MKQSNDTQKDVMSVNTKTKSSAKYLPNGSTNKISIVINIEANPALLEKKIDINSIALILFAK